MLQTSVFCSSVTMPPELVAASRVTRIVVPAPAANSQVGFMYTVLTIDESEYHDTLPFHKGKRAMYCMADATNDISVHCRD